jgi:hypothetical protein
VLILSTPAFRVVFDALGTASKTAAIATAFNAVFKGAPDLGAMLALGTAPAFGKDLIGPDFAVGIDRRLLLGSTVDSCWDRPSALARLSALAGIDRRLLLGSTVGSEKRSDAQPHTANRGRRR